MSYNFDSLKKIQAVSVTNCETEIISGTWKCKTRDYTEKKLKTLSLSRKKQVEQ